MSTLTIKNVRTSRIARAVYHNTTTLMLCGTCNKVKDVVGYCAHHNMHLCMDCSYKHDKC